MLDKIEVNYKTILVGATIGAAWLWLLKRSAAKALEVVAEGAAAAGAAVNPASEENIFFRWTTDVYKKVTGSNEAPGADIYDGVQAVKKSVSTAWDRLTGIIGSDEYADPEDGINL